MSKLQDFLLADNPEKEEIAEVYVPKIPHPFLLRSITEEENKAIRKACQTVTINRKTHQKETETDTDNYLNRLVIESCVEPNWKDAALQKHYGAVGAEALIGRVLNPGQFSALLQAVQTLNGFDEEMNELVDEAKN